MWPFHGLHYSTISRRLAAHERDATLLRRKT
jgi:hypothetical protein